MALPYQLHNKLIQQGKQREIQQSSSSFDYTELQKVFWIWDKKQHLLAHELSEGQCCWNHIVGLPIKDKKQFPLFDYEKILFNALLFNQIVDRTTNFKHKHLWVKKVYRPWYN